MSKDLLYEILSANSRIVRQGKNVTFMWGPAHSAVLGNERADKLAKEAVKKGTVKVNIKLSKAKSQLENKASGGQR